MVSTRNIEVVHTIPGVWKTYTQSVLWYLSSLVRRCAAKPLDLSFSDEKVSLHRTQSSLVKVWQKGILFCSVLWFQRDSTFKMQNIQWKLNEIPNLLHSWPTSFFNLKLNVKGYFLKNGEQCTMNFVELELPCSCNWMPNIFVDSKTEVPNEVWYCSCKHIWLVLEFNINPAERFHEKRNIKISLPFHFLLTVVYQLKKEAFAVFISFQHLKNVLNETNKGLMWCYL